jgi:hypothetical protein
LSAARQVCAAASYEEEDDKHRDLMSLHAFFRHAQNKSAFLQQLLVDDKCCVLIASWDVPSLSYLDNPPCALRRRADSEFAFDASPAGGFYRHVSLHEFGARSRVISQEVQSDSLRRFPGPGAQAVLLPYRVV